jgi:signal transduction histidine kinase
VQEALANIVKHAEASHVSILLTRSERTVAAVVEDDGRGFDGDAIRDDVLGIVGMRERVGLVGGRLRVESTVGSGTTVAAEVPTP